MRQCEWLLVPCLSLLLLASCASVSPQGGQPDVEPSPAVSARSQPVSAGPASAEPASTEPASTEPMLAESTSMEAASTESVTASAEFCDALFVPVTDESQDENEAECAPPGSNDLKGYKKQHTCKLRVADVRPAQPAVGMTAVNCKRDKLVKKNNLDKYLSKGNRVVPTVIGPDGNYYITDHHHLATGVYKTLLEKPDEREKTRLYAEIVGNFFTESTGSPSGSGMREFWRVMQACNNAYLKYLGQPVDPLKPEQMPTALSGMKDDPYRTLSRWVRDADGYIKPDVQPANFLEFTWAEKFRRKLGEVTHCGIGESVESAPCQEQIGELRARLDGAMESARAYDSVPWIQAGNCARNLEGKPEALIACGYNPAFLDVDVDKYITANRGCEDPGEYLWQEVADGALPDDALAWYRYAHGHVAQSYRVCRVSADGASYAGVYEPGSEPKAGKCSYYGADGKKARSSEFDALTGVQAMYLWSEYTEKIAEKEADDFFEDAVPVDVEGAGETYICASGDRIGWVKQGDTACHLKKKQGLEVPFSVLVPD